MKLIYWISTSLLSMILCWSAYSYLFSKSVIEGIKDLGFPDFFRIQLAVLKIIAICILMLPQVPLMAKEWAYAGVGLFFLTSIVAHVAHKDSFALTLINLFFFVLLIVSHIYLYKIKAI